MLSIQHLAIIPDGNRRWAAHHKLESLFGHKQGIKTIQSALDVCLKNKIQFLSFYTFSLENFRRSELEKNYLFSLLAECFNQQRADLIKQQIRIRFIGQRELFPSILKKTIETIEQETENFDLLQVNLLFCYSATAEITHAVKEIAQKVKNNLLSIDEITEETVHTHLWTSEQKIPNPDLIIRTGGDTRLSNFLLLQSAYADFSFLDYLWPDINEEILQTCIDKFKTIKRNFGS